MTHAIGNILRMGFQVTIPSLFKCKPSKRKEELPNVVVSRNKNNRKKNCLLTNDFFDGQLKLWIEDSPCDPLMIRTLHTLLQETPSTFIDPTHVFEDKENELDTFALVEDFLEPIRDKESKEKGEIMVQSLYSEILLNPSFEVGLEMLWDEMKEFKLDGKFSPQTSNYLNNNKRFLRSLSDLLSVGDELRESFKDDYSEYLTLVCEITDYMHQKTLKEDDIYPFSFYYQGHNTR